MTATTSGSGTSRRSAAAPQPANRVPVGDHPGREHCKSFKARPLADGFLTELKDAVRDRRPFDPRTGQPEAEVPADEAITCTPTPLIHRGQMGEPCPGLAPVGRRGPGHRHRRPQHPARRCGSRTPKSTKQGMTRTRRFATMATRTHWK